MIKWQQPVLIHFCGQLKTMSWYRNSLRGLLSPVSTAGNCEFSFTTLLILLCGEDSWGGVFHPAEPLSYAEGTVLAIAHSPSSGLVLGLSLSNCLLVPTTTLSCKESSWDKLCIAWLGLRGACFCCFCGRADERWSFSGTQACGHCLFRAEQGEEEVCCTEPELGHRVSCMSCTHGFHSLCS